MRNVRVLLLILSTTSACGDNISEVTVSLGVAGAPGANIDIIVHNADGTVAMVGATDSEGAFAAPIAQDSMLTVASPRRVVANQGIIMQTIVGVHPGDDIRFDLAPEPRQLGTIEVDFDDAIIADATEYVALTGCAERPTTSNPTINASALVNSWCVGDDGLIDVLGVAYADPFTPLAYAFVKDIVPPPAGESVRVSLPPMDRAHLPRSIRIDDLPDDPIRSPTAFGTLSSLSSGVRLDYSLVRFEDGQASPVIAEDFADSFAYNLSVSRSGETLFTFQTLSEEVESSSDYVIGYTEMLQPVESLEVDASDLEKPRVRFTSGGLASAGHAVGVRFRFGPSEERRSWLMLMPPGTEAATLPTLPAELENPWAPASREDINIAVTVYDAGDAIRYSDVKATAHRLGNDGSGLPSVRVRTATTGVIGRP